ncbi:tetracycline resistance protein [Bacillus sp. CH126_4D]|nr:tetracycline resistance protein [Bacillus sp. CH140a_4T]KAB2473087.1 tetracycline resistance protein [Bacillus sp. CH126_4D]
MYREDLVIRKEVRDMQGEIQAEKKLGYVVVGWLATIIGGEITIITLAILVLVTLGVALCVPSIRRFD